MALFINNNIASLTAQRYVGQANSAVTKSLERLSSGLRINSASDDASGLAISEKLRGQISGLNRASLNAQDGISLLQTAEGGLSNIQDMVQRMRELAVQAGNGVYTSSDRSEIQKEIDQLKEEIDRISTSTEFNTKKLLNGDSTALWSSDSSDIDVIVKSKVAEGNYNLNVTVDPGSNYVYKTDVMTLNEGSIGAEIVTAGASGANETNVAAVSEPSTMPATGTAYFTVKVSSGATGMVIASAVSTAGVYAQTGSSFIAVQSGATTISSSGYVEFELTSTVSSGTTSSITGRVRFADAKTGELTDWMDVTSTSQVNGDITFSTSGLTDADGGAIDFNFHLNAGTTGNAQEGDKILFAVSETFAAGEYAASGGGTIQISGGPENITGPTLSYTTASALTTHDNGDSTIDYNDVTVYYAQLNSETGNLDLGNLTLNFKEYDSATDGDVGQTLIGDFDIEVAGGGDAATSTTKLKDISVFTTDDGVNLFDDTQSLTIYGNGTSATIYLEGDDTISDFETKLTDAIVNGLGMGADTGTSSTVSNVNNNLVNYVSSGDVKANSNQAVQGTFVIQTAMLGKDSTLSFTGDESLIEAFSLNTIQYGENSEVKVKVTDAHSGAAVGTDTVNDNVLRNVIEGVDVVIDSDVGIDISWDEASGELKYSATGASDDIKLHLVDNAMEMQIGANEGQTILTNIPEISTESLGIDDVIIVDQESAQSAITKLDKALETVSGVRATIGAQINRLEYTISGLTVQSENLTAAESRIRDLDMASEMSKFTSNQILSQSSVAMLSQANSLPQLALSLLG
jgi:flagellin